MPKATKMFNGEEPTILVATTNAGKLRELREAFSDMPASFIGLDEIASAPVVAEIGLTFGENAAIKASAYGRYSSLPALADDSGLEIDALDGRPGIHSARYAQGAPYARKIEMLLSELKGVERDRRSARFRCAIALAGPSGEVVRIVEGVCEGHIGFHARGTNGFGYDPIFIPEGFDETFGELPDELKHAISHRARATSAIKPYLRDFMAF